MKNDDLNSTCPYGEDYFALLHKKKLAPLNFCVEWGRFCA